MSSLITLIIVILWQIQCTQPTPQQKGTECSADFDLSAIINITTNRNVCPVVSCVCVCVWVCVCVCVCVCVRVCVRVCVCVCV